MNQTCTNCKNEFKSSDLNKLYNKFAWSMVFRPDMSVIQCPNCMTKHVITQDSLSLAVKKERIDMLINVASFLFAYSIVRSQGFFKGIAFSMFIIGPAIYFLYRRAYNKAKKYFDFVRDEHINH